MRFHSSNVTVGNLTFEADQSEFPVSVSNSLLCVHAEVQRAAGEV